MRNLPPRISAIVVLNKIDLSSAEPAIRDFRWVAAESSIGDDGRWVWMCFVRRDPEALGWDPARRACSWRGHGIWTPCGEQPDICRSVRQRHETGVCSRKSYGWPSAALGEITGEVTADDLLGEIFSRFCIGK